MAADRLGHLAEGVINGSAEPDRAGGRPGGDVRVGEVDLEPFDPRGLDRTAHLVVAGLGAGNGAMGVTACFLTGSSRIKS